MKISLENSLLGAILTPIMAEITQTLIKEGFSPFKWGITAVILIAIISYILTPWKKGKDQALIQDNYPEASLKYANQDNYRNYLPEGHTYIFNHSIVNFGERSQQKETHITEDNNTGFRTKITTFNPSIPGERDQGKRVQTRITSESKNKQQEKEKRRKKRRNKRNRK